MNALKRFLCAMGLLIAVWSNGCGRHGDSEVVYTTPDGKKSKDVAALNGDVSYQVVGGKPIPHEAELLHQQARAKGEAGDYDSALRLLEQASRIAPEWAYPPYDMAFTYLLKGQADKALEKYIAVDRMEPKGFFTTKTAVWSLQKEQKGEFPMGTYLTYVSLEWAEPAKKRDLVERLTTNTPLFTPAWKEEAPLAENNGERIALITKALSLDADAETRGILMLNKAALLNKAGQREEALRLVEELRTNESTTLSTSALAVEMQKMFKKGAK